jgi:hypothetical protein
MLGWTGDGPEVGESVGVSEAGLVALGTEVVVGSFVEVVRLT